MNKIPMTLLFVLAALPLGAAEVPPTASKDLTLAQVVVDVLAANRDLRVKRLAPSLAEQAFEQSRAIWDPNLSAQVNKNTVTDASNLQSGALSSTIGLSQPLPTGTTVGLEATTTRTTVDARDPAWSTRAGLSVTQSLLKGASLGANLASLHQATLDLRISRFEVRALATAVVFQAEEAFWKVYLGEHRVVIVRESLALAQQFAAETVERIRLGTLAGSEQAVSDAEVAGRQADLIDAEAALDEARLRLLDLMNAPFTQQINLLADPDSAASGDSVEILPEHLQVANVRRPDLDEAELRRQRGELELVRTRNGLLPKLELFANLGRTGYAGAFAGSSRGDEGRGLDTTVGLRFEYLIGNRAAEVTHESARISSEEAQLALANLKRLAELDVRLAWNEVKRAEAQRMASATRVAARAENLRSVAASAEVGRKSPYLVALAQRDLLQARLDEAESAVRVRTSRAALYQSDGSLLQRRGIHAPGWE